MTDVLIRRGGSDTDTYRGKTVWGCKEKMAIYKPRSIEETNPGDTLTLDFQLLELEENKSLWFEPPGLWYFVMVALATKTPWLKQCHLCWLRHLARLSACGEGLLPDGSIGPPPPFTLYSHISLHPKVICGKNITFSAFILVDYFSGSGKIYCDLFEGNLDETKSYTYLDISWTWFIVSGKGQETIVKVT